MSFMIPMIIGPQEWALVGDEYEAYWTPSEYVMDDDKIQERTTGFGAYLSAPGYLDRTDTAVFDTLKEAAQYLIDTYYDVPDDEMTDEEQEERAELEAVR